MLHAGRMMMSRRVKQWSSKRRRLRWGGPAVDDAGGSSRAERPTGSSHVYRCSRGISARLWSCLERQQHLKRPLGADEPRMITDLLVLLERSKRSKKWLASTFFLQNPPTLAGTCGTKLKRDECPDIPESNSFHALSPRRCGARQHTRRCAAGKSTAPP